MINYIGVDDHKIDLFEGQYIVEHGMSYNSYVIMDDLICVLDTVDYNFKDEWLANLKKVLNGREPNYLVVHHMEMDHSANIEAFLNTYKNAKVVASIGAFNMMKNLFENDFVSRRIVVKDNDKLELGHHTLTFFTAPLVHWPEVIFSYESSTKSLFSADAFGKFGALDYEDKDGWACEARRYYFGIVSKFGLNVQNVLKKLSNLEIKTIYPLHGPILKENISYYLNKYDIWSKYEPEDKGVTICYTSVYGNTLKAVQLLKEELEKKKEKVALFDLARSDNAEAIEDAFRYDRLVLATTTYNGDIFPFMKTFIATLEEHNYQNRKVALIENGMWAPNANKIMKEKLSNLKNIEIVQSVTIKGALNAVSKSQIKELALLLSR